MYDNIPVNQRPDYLAHVLMLKENYEFLISDHGFEIKLSDWCSYEFTTIYKKENIEIEIMFTTSTPSSVHIINWDLPYDESKNLKNFDYIGPCNELTAKKIDTILKNNTGVINKALNKNG